MEVTNGTAMAVAKPKAAHHLPAGEHGKLRRQRGGAHQQLLVFELIKSYQDEVFAKGSV
jgi:hypothetical protein